MSQVRGSGGGEGDLILGEHYYWGRLSLSDPLWPLIIAPVYRPLLVTAGK